MSVGCEYAQSLRGGRPANAKDSLLRSCQSPEEAPRPSSESCFPAGTAVSPQSSIEMLAHQTPGSPSASPTNVPGSQEQLHKRPLRKQRTVFSQTQLYTLHDRFQKQKYLSLQQMQELSALLNLSPKQVKTWFQNQRMKYKRLQSRLLTDSGLVSEMGFDPMDYGDQQATSHLAPATSGGSFPFWDNQMFNNNPSWGPPLLNPQPWNSHSQGWNQSFPQRGEPWQFQTDFLGGDPQSSRMSEGSHPYSYRPQSMDCVGNYFANFPPSGL